MPELGLLLNLKAALPLPVFEYEGRKGDLLSAAPGGAPTFNQMSLPKNHQPSCPQLPQRRSKCTPLSKNGNGSEELYYCCNLVLKLFMRKICTNSLYQLQSIPSLKYGIFCKSMAFEVIEVKRGFKTEAQGIKNLGPLNMPI